MLGVFVYICLGALVVLGVVAVILKVDIPWGKFPPTWWF